MTNRRTLASAFLLCGTAVALPSAAAGQVALPQPQNYLLVSDVADGRALWVNPANLARRLEAAVGAHVSVRDSLSELHASQYGVLIATHGFAFGWNRDDFGGGRAGNVYALGAGFGDEAFALGVNRKWFRGAGSAGGSYDVGLHYLLRPGVTVDAAWRHIGSPTVRDSVLEEQLASGVALALFNGRARLSGEWRVATSGFVTRSVRAGLAAAIGRGMRISAVTDMSSDVRQRAFTIAVHIERPTLRMSLFRREAQLRNVADLMGLSATSVSPAPSRRRFSR